MLHTLRNTFKFLAFGLFVVLIPVSSVPAQDIVNGALNVESDAAANTIRFSIDGNDVVVLVDNNESRFALVDVDRILVRTFGGDDTVINNTHIRMRAVGGNGNDRLVGGSGDDDLVGQAGDDTLFGRDGDDKLEGAAGVDYLSGGNGDDVLVSVGDRFTPVDTHFGGAGEDWLTGGADMYGGPGIDLIDDELDEIGSFQLGRTVIAAGGPEDDAITVRRVAGELVVRIKNSGLTTERTYSDIVTSFELRGLDGDDVLANFSDVRVVMVGGLGDDLSMTNTDDDECINEFEPGNDVYVLHGGRVRHEVDSDIDFHAITVIGSERDERVYFRTGWPVFSATGVSQIDLGAGDDIYEGDDNYFAAVTVRGGTGNDDITGGWADDNERLFGDEGDDLIDGDTGDNIIYGGAGNDTITTASSAGFIGYDSTGVNFLSGGPGNDRIEGGRGDNIIYGGAGDDNLSGNVFGDVIRGQGGDDIMFGGDGNDRMFGGTGSDELFGERGDDVLQGQGGSDLLNGGLGNDWLLGGPDNDVLVGGSGQNVLTQ